MKCMQRVLVSVLFVGFIIPAGAETFNVANIRVIGLQRFAPSSVTKAAGLHVGMSFNTNNSGKVISSLYNTGNFTNVSLDRQGNTLIVHVNERPVISGIMVNGNKTIKNKQIKEVLNSSGISLGQAFNQAKFTQFIIALQQQYTNMGHYGAKVSDSIKPLPRNRVALVIDINEGGVAKIKSIRFEGNTQFSQRQLRRSIKSSTGNILSFITHSNDYSEQQLDVDMQSLADFYYNHGYLLFRVVDKNVSIASDQKDVNITITVDPGPIFHLTGASIAGNTLGSDKDLLPLLKPLQPGMVFSRETVLGVASKIRHYYADYGYAMTQVLPKPNINVQNRTVSLVFIVNPGSRYYVRRIDFLGNTETRQDVLRTNMVQNEASLYSQKDIDDSNRKLANVPYIKVLNTQTVPVAGTNNQLDMIYHVKESTAGSISVNGGYSDTEGFLYGLTFNEPNFLGTGKAINFSFSKSKYQSNYSASYFNPFYSPNGIGRGFDAFYYHITPGDVDIADYILNQFGFDVKYSIPFTLNSYINTGFGYTNYNVRSASQTPDSILSFISKHGRNFNEGTLDAGWSYQSTDRYMFPTDGVSQNVDGKLYAPLDNKSLTFYTVDEQGDVYMPLNKKHSWVLNFHTNSAYGNSFSSNDSLPFFMNFYAGGLGTVPGFSGNTLGPKDSYDNSLGGNILMTAGTTLYIPNFISNNLRIGFGLDGGNVFQNSIHLSGQKGPRYAASLLFGVKLPMFPQPLLLGISEPLNKFSGDDKQIFGFSMSGAI